MGQKDLRAKDDDAFDSLAAALEVLNITLFEDIVETEEQIKYHLAKKQQDRKEISRLGGYLMVLKYALGVFRALGDPFCKAGQEILRLDDNPSRLPEIMKSALDQLKFMHSTGGLLKSSMTLLPSDINKMHEKPKTDIPELDRNSVALGNSEALKWLELFLFPLFETNCPPPDIAGPRAPFPEPGPAL